MHDGFKFSNWESFAFYPCNLFLFLYQTCTILVTIQLLGELPVDFGQDHSRTTLRKLR